MQNVWDGWEELDEQEEGGDGKVCPEVVFDAAAMGDLKTLRYLFDGDKRRVSEKVWRIRDMSEFHRPEIDDFDEHGRTVLHLVAANGHVSCVKYILSLGADVERRDENMRTALDVALSAGHVECALSILREYDKEQNPLLAVAEHGNVDCLRYLLGKFDVNSQDDMGVTALHVAAEHGHAPAVSFLLKHGAKVDLQDFSGRSALFGAAERERVMCVQVLLAHGADAEMEDRGGDTPKSVANGKAVRRLLRNRAR